MYQVAVFSLLFCLSAWSVPVGAQHPVDAPPQSPDAIDDIALIVAADPAGTTVDVRLRLRVPSLSTARPKVTLWPRKVEQAPRRHYTAPLAILGNGVFATVGGAVLGVSCHRENDGYLTPLLLGSVMVVVGIIMLIFHIRRYRLARAGFEERARPLGW